MCKIVGSDEKEIEVAIKANNNNDEQRRDRFNSSFHQYRFIIACLGGTAVGLVLLLRYSISMAIIQMVNQTAIYMRDHPNRTVEDFLAEGYSLGGDFDWDTGIQQIIMSWYMFAYTLPQLPCTRFALFIGHRKSMPLLLTICGLTSILTPPAAYLGWVWVLILRLIQGVAASATTPMQLGLIENWMPYDEMGLGIIFITLIPATVLPLIPLFVGYLSNIHWSHTFYAPGIITIVFCLIWYIFVTDRPDENWLISDRELSKIHIYQNNQNHTDHDDATKVPDSINIKERNSMVGEHQGKVQGEVSWTLPLKIPSFYAFLVMWILHCSAMNNFLFLLPTYLRRFLKIGISLNGTYCFMVQIGSIFAILWVYPFLQILQTNCNLSLTTSRRVAYAIVVFMVGGSWLLIGLLHKHQLILLAINRYFHSTTDFLVTGTIISNYAKVGLSSTAYSMINSVGNLTFVATSTLIGYILGSTKSSEEAWSWIFIAGSITQFIMLMIYSTMISSNPILVN